VEVEDLEEYDPSKSRVADNSLIFDPNKSRTASRVLDSSMIYDPNKSRVGDNSMYDPNKSRAGDNSMFREAE